VARLLAEFRVQKRFDEIPGHQRANGAPTHAKNIHVVVFNALLGRKMVVDQCCPNTVDLIRAHRCAHSTPADGNSAIDSTSHNGTGERKDVVRIIISIGDRIST